jgi:hypothetical protein
VLQTRWTKKNGMGPLTDSLALAKTAVLWEHKTGAVTVVIGIYVSFRLSQWGVFMREHTF